MSSTTENQTKGSEPTEHASRDESIARLAKKIKGIKFAMLTTLDPDGVLRSRPMATLDHEFKGELWFFTRNDSGKVHSIENEQHVNLAYSKPDDQDYVSVAGRASIVEDREKMKELWTPAMKAWFPDELEDPHIALLRIDVDSAEIWDSSPSTFVHLAGIAKAVVTGRSYAENKHSERVDLKH